MFSIIRGPIIRAAGLGLLILGGSAALAATAFAASHGRVAQQDDAVAIIFKSIEKQIIREYFGGDTGDAAKGRGGKKKKAKGGKARTRAATGEEWYPAARSLEACLAAWPRLPPRANTHRHRACDCGR